MSVWIVLVLRYSPGLAKNISSERAGTSVHAAPRQKNAELFSPDNITVIVLVENGRLWASWVLIIIYAWLYWR